MQEIQTTKAAATFRSPFLAVLLVVLLATAFPPLDLIFGGGGPARPAEASPPPELGPAALPDPDALENLRAEAATAGLTPAQGQALLDRVTRVADSGLPWRPLLDRVRQGLAKRAPFERIDAVCAGLEARLHESASLVDGALPVADRRRPLPGRIELIDHTAFALEKGVEPASLGEMFASLRTTADQAAPSPPSGAAALSAPVVALTSLTAQGVPPADGVDLVKAAWQKGVRGGQMEGLGFMLSQALRRGEPLSLVGETSARFHRGELAQQILSELRDRFGGPPHPGGLRPPGGPGDQGPPHPPGRPGWRRPGAGRPGSGEGPPGTGDHSRKRPPRRPPRPHGRPGV